MDLGQYEQTKFELAEALRLMQPYIRRDDQGAHEQGITDLFSRLAEDRFNLVVAGRFSRGKTSLMNAILGTDRLPTGIRPLTSVITTAAYGSKEQAIIKRIGFRIDEQIPLDALADYITEKGNSGNVRRIRMAEVQLPAELLRRGFYFVDTPGLGSPIIANTRTTEEFLPEADALLLVTSYESPLSEEELRTLRSAASRRVFVVVNKQDLVSPDEREEVLRYLEEQLHGLPGHERPRIFSVSARDGLEAKQRENTERLTASGIPALEKELLRFLIEEKSSEFLLRMCERVIGLLRELPSVANGSQVKERIDTLSRRIAGSRGEMAARATPIVSSVSGQDTHSLLPHCEICAHVGSRLFDFLTRLQYDIIFDPENQRIIAERGGLCSFHTWQYQAVASPHGTCVGYPYILDRLAAELRNLAASPSAGMDVGALMARPETCLGCAEGAATEAETVKSIGQRLRENLEQSLRSLSALCLPHFCLLLESVGEHEVRRRLIARQAALLQRLSEEMRRYALKHDGLRRFLASEEETSAAERALLMLAGHRAVNMP